jgi:transposase
LLRPGTDLTSATIATKLSRRSLARRQIALAKEIKDLDAALAELTVIAAPGLIAKTGVGIDVAGQLLLTAGDNPERLRSEASFAGVASIPASSGRTNRHRLNRGGDRAANKALHTIAPVRLKYDDRTRAYARRRTAEGLSSRDIMRRLKRAIAREIYHELTQPTGVSSALTEAPNVGSKAS